MFPRRQQIAYFVSFRDSVEDGLGTCWRPTGGGLTVKATTLRDIVENLTRRRIDGRPPIMGLERSMVDGTICLKSHSLGHSQSGSAMDEVTKLAVASEELSVTKRLVQGETVKVGVRVKAQTLDVDLPSTNETVIVETVQIDREIFQIPEIRTEGNVTIIPIIREEAVLVKRLILEKEVRLTKIRTETTRTEAVTLRSEQAVIEKCSPSPSTPTESES